MALTLAYRFPVMIKAVVFDFGGVLAGEGFREGLKEIARSSGIDEEAFFRTAEDVIYSTGYVTGLASETVFWNSLREKTGVGGTDEELRARILNRFVLRPRMLEIADRMRSSGIRTAILSDQTNWLAELDDLYHFSLHFDLVLNSYVTGMSKRDPATFRDACGRMGLDPAEVVFVDDNGGNIRRAADVGMKTIHFRTFEGFERELRVLLA